MSFHALDGSRPSNQTLLILGQVDHYPIHIWVDSQSTHNFVQQGVTNALGLEGIPTSILKVLVGNGESLTCDRMYKNVQLMIQSRQFNVDLYVLEISG